MRHGSITAVLTDTLSLRYVPPGDGEIRLRYPAIGTALSGRSLSHPDQSQWQAPCERTNGSHQRQEPAHYAMRTRLGPVGTGRHLVQNRIEHGDAFSRPDERWLHVQVAYPTDSLTLLVRFPHARPYRSLRGLWQRHSGAPLASAIQQPLQIAAGQLAYWRIAAPTPGETYRLGWT